MRPELWYLPFSPWSLKARCALRLRGIDVTAREYVPLVDEPRLRLRLRRVRGRVTVPVLFAPKSPLTDSFDIALYAEHSGSGPSLLPEARLPEIRAWNERSERFLSAGRVRSMLRVAAEPAAALETLPPRLGGFLGERGARLAVAAFNRKYGIRPAVAQQARTALVEELEHLRAALNDGRPYLLGDFSYADIAMCLALQLVKPLPNTPLGESSRAATTDRALSEEFADLIAYRDRVDAEYGLLATPQPRSSTSSPDPAYEGRAGETS